MPICITGTGVYAPEHIITNDELVESFNTYVAQFNAENAEKIAAGEVTALAPSSSEFIVKASGIKLRHVVDKAGILDPQRMVPHIPERPNSQISIQAEMACNAAREAMREANVQPDEIDMVILSCSVTQRAYPAISIEVQDALGIKNAFAFDMNAACSSASFGLQQAYATINSGMARKVLMVNPELTSGHMNWRVRDSHFIFGDVATAVVIEETDSKPGLEILNTRSVTSFSNAIRNNFGYMNRTDEARRDDPDKLFIQEGRKVYKEVSPMVARLIAEQLEEQGLQTSDISRFWMHQANSNMNALILKILLKEEPDNLRAPIILDRFANTGSAGSIIALHHHKQDLPPGALGILCAFGAGYSIGSLLLRKV